MASANAVLGVPKHGRGAHADMQNLALDGRGQLLMAASGTLDTSDHSGSLYWVVSRTSEAPKANLVLDQVSWEQKVSVTVPALKKRRKTHQVDWSSSEVPSVPVMVNPKAIKAHTMLALYLPEPPKANRHSSATGSSGSKQKA